ncbi:WD40 repeat-like protein [Athelia psychrophila]|uniref:WD40 repeat-like protein n=1 Tax=Athelia psychrophila TaxID=1759441 RepID=A0A165Y917_9AGAM|nr:WD40 repeat-like protein [Fibularhizoctonia sp. CBS 109695]
MAPESGSEQSGTSATAIVKAKISNIHCSQLPKTTGWKSPLYIKILLEGQDPFTTSKVKGNSAPSWTDSYSFSAASSSNIEIQIYEDHRFRSDKNVGGFKVTIKSLLNEKTTVSRELWKADSRGAMRKLPTSTISFTLSVLSQEVDVNNLRAEEMISQAGGSLAQMGDAPSTVSRTAETVTGIVDQAADGVKSVSDTWDSLLNKIELFMTLTDAISEIHPYAKTARFVLSAIPKVIIAQQDRDNSIHHSMETIDDTHSFVLEAEPLKKIQSHRRIIDNLSALTVECAYLIRDYALDKNFSTACGAILEEDGQSGLDVTELLEEFLEAKSLDGLYMTILRRAFKEDDPRVMDRFKRVMGTILAGKEPLSKRSYLELWCDGDDQNRHQNRVELILSPLGSLLSGTNDMDTPIHALHTSFFDFLINKDRSLPDHSWNSEAGEAVGPPFEGHSKGVTFVAYSPDGKHIVSGSEDNTVCVWDTETGEAVRSPFEGHSEDILSVAYSPDGKHIVTGSADNTVRVWDSGMQKRPVRLADVFAVAYSPDGKYIVSSSWDNTTRVWNMEKGEAVGFPFGVDSWLIFSVVYSPDGKHIVSGSADNTIRVWDAETGGAVSSPFEGHTGSVNSVTYSPDGKHIVSGSDDNTIRVWDVETGKAVGPPFEGHNDRVSSVAHSPDGKHVVSGSWDNTIRIWNAENAETGEAVGSLLEGHSEVIRCVAFSPDGKHIDSASHDKTVRVWDTNGKGGATVDESDITSAVFRDNSKLENGWILTPTSSSSRLLFWVPPWHRQGLWWPRNTAVIAPGSMRLELGTFVHGVDWEQCQLQAPL